MAASLTAACLPAATRSRLRWLGRQPWSKVFYLAGGAALAIRLGHRRPRGLDLMSASDRLDSPGRRDLMMAIAPDVSGVRVETARDGFLDLLFPDDVPVRLFHYPYPQVDPAGRVEGVEIASAADLALMKLGAVISRGAKRDFVDLYLLTKGLSLGRVLERASEKFPQVRDFPLQALKGLADRGVARSEPMPRLTIDGDWKMVERWIDTDVRDLARTWVGLGAGDQMGT